MKQIFLPICASLLVAFFLHFSPEVRAQSEPVFTSGHDPKSPGQSWVKVEALSDEFEGGTLDPNKWTANPEFLWNGQDRGWYGSARSLFQEENATVTNGQMRIEAKMFASPQYAPSDDQSNPPARKYGGAYVYGKTLAKPGYYMEARMQASQTAMSAAFWLMSESKPCIELPNNGEKSELDIQECVGVMTGELGDEWTNDDWAVNAKWDRIFHYNTHRHTTWECYSGEQQTVGGKVNLESGTNASAFHIYGAYWYPDGNRVDFFLDGDFIKSVTPAVPFTAPLKLIMSSNFYDWIKEIEPEAMGFNKTKADRSSKFDWVRVWELEGEAQEVFFIINKETGKKIRCGNNTDGAPLQLVPASWNGSPTQWEKVDTGDGYFHLRNVDTGFYFRPTNETDGSVLIQRPDSYNGDFTRWKTVAASGGYYYLENKETGMWFRPESEVDYAPLLQRPTSYSGDWTQWQLVSVQTGTPLRMTAPLSTEYGLQEVKVFPNPVTNGLLHMRLPSSPVPAQVTITDTSGRTLYQEMHYSGELNLPINGMLRSGQLYLVHVQVEGKSFTERILVE
ncbi:RICIN domain-containing protein [Persicobacter diffluens]|uniref:GH16 domain-containing protein n=1 Tax=Persicobacter diffluens TaxID=981 RepID=A0AAN4VWX6_9BACT|nr:hypothetical protein PEDI_17750 [Persicobacter diffluens]